MLSSRAVAPLTQIALMLTRVRYAISAMKTLNGVMNLQDERVATESFVNRAVEHGKIEFRNVAFQYPLNTRLVLDGINLTISPGEKVGIIGKVGPARRPSDDWSRDSTRRPKAKSSSMASISANIIRMKSAKLSALVMQDTDLFIGSIKANLLLANPSASDADLIKACKLAGVDDFVSLIRLGYDLPVGERGPQPFNGTKAGGRPRAGVADESDDSVSRRAVERDGPLRRNKAF